MCVSCASHVPRWTLGGPLEALSCVFSGQKKEGIPRSARPHALQAWQWDQGRGHCALTLHHNSRVPQYTTVLDSTKEYHRIPSTTPSPTTFCGHPSHNACIQCQLLLKSCAPHLKCSHSVLGAPSVHHIICIPRILCILHMPYIWL